MTRIKYHRFLIPFGILIILIAVSGLPAIWKEWLSVCLGALVVIVSLAFRQEYNRSVNTEKNAEEASFIENEGSLSEILPPR